jgi:hypothetical protein
MSRAPDAVSAQSHTCEHQQGEPALRTKEQVVALLESVLGIEGRLHNATDGMPLLGAIPELDSMAVATVLTALEERFGFLIDDDEIDGSAFATIGSLVSFVDAKLADSNAQGDDVSLSIRQA